MSKIFDKYYDLLLNIFDCDEDIVNLVGCKYNIENNIRRGLNNTYTIADYRRDFNNNYCDKVDVLMWGETDSLIPRQTFEILDSLDTTQSSETMYNNIMSAHQEAAEKTIPLKQKKKKRVPWDDKNIIEKRINLKIANDQKQNYTTPENILKYEIAQNDLINEYAKNQEKYINQKINEI